MQEMHDIIGDAPLLQELLRRGRVQGREEAREEEHQKNLVSLRHMLQRAVETRFPGLDKFAQEQAALIEREDVLNDLILKVITAQTSEEYQRYLLNWR